jgi:hypothetical protein
MPICIGADEVAQPLVSVAGLPGAISSTSNGLRAAAFATFAANFIPARMVWTSCFADGWLNTTAGTQDLEQLGERNVPALRITPRPARTATIRSAFS